jgi:hypothetical protein
MKRSFVSTLIVTLFIAASAMAGGEISVRGVQELVKISEVAKKNPQAALEQLATAGVINLEDANAKGAGKSLEAFQRYTAEAIARSGDTAVVRRALDTLGVKYTASQISALEVSNSAKKISSATEYSQIGKGTLDLSATKARNTSKSTSARAESANTVAAGAQKLVQSFLPNASAGLQAQAVDVMVATGVQPFKAVRMKQICGEKFGAQASNVAIEAFVKAGLTVYADDVARSAEKAIKSGERVVCEVGKISYAGNTKLAAENMATFAEGGICDISNRSVTDIGGGIKSLESKGFACN